MCRLLFCQNAAELLYMNCDRIQALRTALILSLDISRMIELEVHTTLWLHNSVNDK